MKITVISTCSTSWSNLSNNLETIPWLSRIYAKKIFDTTIVLQYSVVTRGLLDPQYNRFSILTKTSTVTKTDLQSNITVASRTLSPLLFTTRWPCVNLKSPLRDFPRTWYPEIFRSVSIWSYFDENTTSRLSFCGTFHHIDRIFLRVQENGPTRSESDWQPDITVLWSHIFFSIWTFWHTYFSPSVLDPFLFFVLFFPFIF